MGWVGAIIGAVKGAKGALDEGAKSTLGGTDGGGTGVGGGGSNEPALSMMPPSMAAPNLPAVPNANMGLMAPSVTPPGVAPDLTKMGLMGMNRPYGAFDTPPAQNPTGALPPPNIQPIQDDTPSFWQRPGTKKVPGGLLGAIQGASGQGGY